MLNLVRLLASLVLLFMTTGVFASVVDPQSSNNQLQIVSVEQPAVPETSPFSLPIDYSLPASAFQLDLIVKPHSDGTPSFQFEPLIGINLAGGEGSLESEFFVGRGGLYYYNARFYDPTLGRFLNEDPARSGDNWEIYALDNPLRFVDPTGLYIIGSTAEQNKTFQQSGSLYLGLTSDSIALEGCFLTAAVRDINTVNGNSALTLDSFGSNALSSMPLNVQAYAGVGSNPGSNVKYINQDALLKYAQLVHDKTSGTWSGDKTSDTADISSTLEALQHMQSPAMAIVNGTVRLTTGQSPHSEDVAPYRNGTVLNWPGEFRYDATSIHDNDKRTFTLGSNVTSLSYMIPTSAKHEFTALKDTFSGKSESTVEHDFFDGATVVPAMPTGFK